MLPGETLTQALQRIYEQVNGNRSFETFEQYVGLDSVFERSARRAADWAMGSRFRDAKVTKGHPGYEEVTYQVAAIYHPGLLRKDVYNYHITSSLYIKMVEDFRAKLTECLQGFYPDVKVSVQTGYGGRKNTNDSNYTFTFYVTLKVKPEMPRAQAA